MKDRKSIQEKSIQYIKDNREDVARNNQRVLLVLNFLCFLVVVAYLVASHTLFKDWNVAGLYTGAAIIQFICLVVMVLRFGGKVRSYKEVNRVCMAFQLYAMTFVGMMSVIPLEKNQPAVYFAPIGMVFVACFVYNYYQELILLSIEMGVYLLVAILFKSDEVMPIDVCSTVLAYFMSIFLANNLYSWRISENETRQNIKKMGMIDALTGVYNKSSTEFLCKSYLRSKPNRPCVMMVLDFDDFKSVNDTYGHQGGDFVLRSFGRILKKEADLEHIAGRIGGDEFFLFLKDCGPKEAEAMAVRILNQTRLITASDNTRPFSCSIGVAVKKPSEDWENATVAYRELFTRADQMLYRVKEKGKNNYLVES